MYKITLDFKNEILNYDKVSEYKVKNNFLILYVDGKKLYFNTNKLDYFKVNLTITELDAENFWTQI